MTEKPEKKPIRVLLLDDRYDNLILRTAILRSRGLPVGKTTYLGSFA